MQSVSTYRAVQDGKISRLDCYWDNTSINAICERAVSLFRRIPMNQFQNIFDAQNALFATGVTRTHEWRVDLLDRMARMIKENEGRFQKAMAKDFKTASQEYIFEAAASAGESEVQKSQLREWMKPVEAPVSSNAPTSSRETACSFAP